MSRAFRPPGHVRELIEIYSGDSVVSCPNRSGVRNEITHCLEQSFLKMIRCVRPEATVEIGAHEAAFSGKAVEYARSGLALALEANRYVYEKYRSLQDSRVRYLNLAVADFSGTVVLNIPTSVDGTPLPIHNAIGSIRRRANTVAYKSDESSVPAVTLDELGQVYSLARSAIWIDVEGCVDKVISGGREVLSSALLVYVELEAKEFWRGQLLAADIQETFSELGLEEIARDCTAKNQFNCVLGRVDSSHYEQILEIGGQFVQETRAIVSRC